MARKKWFGVAAVVVAIGGAVGYALRKVNESPESLWRLSLGLSPQALLREEEGNQAVDVFVAQ
jgi:hypothetical protein